MNDILKTLILAILLYGMTAAQASDENGSEKEMTCEQKYKILEDKLWANEQDTNARLYDYIEGNIDHERDMETIKECLELSSAKEIRQCVKTVLQRYEY